jgi:hypothetical protein
MTLWGCHVAFVAWLGFVISPQKLTLALTPNSDTTASRRINMTTSIEEAHFAGAIRLELENCPRKRLVCIKMPSSAERFGSKGITFFPISILLIILKFQPQGFERESIYSSSSFGFTVQKVPQVMDPVDAVRA